MSDQEIQSRKRQIEALVEAYYRKLEFLHYESLDFFVNRAMSLFLDSDLSIDEINDKLLEAVLEQKKRIDNRYNSNNVLQNHKEIYLKLEELISLLNEEGIDYQLAGSLCGYIKYNQESNRVHDDIDINLNEKDIEKFQKVCEKMGLQFQDNRLTSPRILKNGIPSGEHEVIATSRDSNFHIGAFCFERLIDGTVISKGYYHNEENQACAREEIISSELAKELFGREQVDFHGKPVYITAPEYVYLLKKYTNSQKDQYDINFLEDKIDKERVDRIRKLSKTDRFIQYVSVHELPPVRKLNPNKIENDNSEISQMLVESSSIDKVVEKGSFDNPKQMKKTKRDSSKMEGSASSYAIVVSFLIVSLLVLIGLIIFQWIKL